MYTKALAGYVAQTRFEDLSPQVVREARLAFLDWLGSALAGADKEPGRIVTDMVVDMGGKEEATLLPTGTKTSAPLAALVNGTVSHIVELDDVHKASILHAGAPIIPAALAAAERCRAGGREMITGIVVGYDVGIRIGEAVTPSHYHFWHTTGTCGTFGAAAAAAKVQGLDADAVIQALGTAGTQAAGLWEFLIDGAMSKHLHPGKAAMNGLMAALLAERGFTAATRILEGEKGFCKATAKEFNLEKITAGLGEQSKILENCYKIHSSCRHTHHAVDVILELVRKHNLLPGDIERIGIKTYAIAIDITGNFHPATPYAAKFSLPYCVAAAVKFRGAGLAEFAQEHLNDPDMKDLMSRVDLAVDPASEKSYPDRWPASVELTLRSGDVLQGKTDYPKGDPENPVSAEELEEKFRALTAGLLDEKRMEELIQRCRRLEEEPDVSALLALLCKG